MTYANVVATLALNPGTSITITAQLRGDVDCTAGSRLDRLEVRILQIK